MTTPRVINEQDLRANVCMDETALEAVTDAFRWHHRKLVAMPPVMRIAATDRHGDVDVKSAYVRGMEIFAVKIASGFYENEKRGLPFGGGLVVVLSAETGFCEAVLLDNAYLTDLRTGLAGAVAARLLAPAAVETAGIVGSGVQARYQLRCLRLVRNLDRVLVWDRRPERAQAYVDEISKTECLPVEAVNLEQLVRSSQIVITATAATTPLIRADWLHPCLHITAVGADMPGKQELEADIMRKADIKACDSIEQCLVGGELQHVVKEPGAARSLGVIELGAVVEGAAKGRATDEQLSVCDLTGMGVQDTAIAALALRVMAQRVPRPSL